MTQTENKLVGRERDGTKEGTPETWRRARRDFVLEEPAALAVGSDAGSTWPCQDHAAWGQRSPISGL